MDTRTLTSFETNLLQTAAHLIQPFDPDLLTKMLRHPERGIINVIGKLVNRSLLRHIPGDGYIFHSHKFMNQLIEDTPLERRQAIYRKLFNIISDKTIAIPFHERSRSKAWAALKLGAPEAVECAVEALDCAFLQVDDVSAEGIFCLCNETWPESVPKPIQLKMAEFDYLRGNYLIALEKIQRSIEMFPSDSTSSLAYQSRILLLRIKARIDASFPLLCNLWQLSNQDIEHSDLRPLVVMAVVRCQELGQESLASVIINKLCSDNQLDDATHAENLWLLGRQALLGGDINQSRDLFQYALRTIERQTNRTLGAHIMMDIARMHGMNGNTVREARCLRLVDNLLKRGYRDALHSMLALHRLDMLLDDGKINQAANYIDRLFRETSGQTGHFRFAIAALGGAVVAGKLNQPAVSVQYLRELFRTPASIPAELMTRIDRIMDDPVWRTRRYVKTEHSVLKSLYEIAYRENPWLPSGIDTHRIPRPTIEQAEFLRQGQLVWDHLMDSMITEEPDLSRETGKMTKLVTLAERIGDECRWSMAVKMLLKSRPESNNTGVVPQNEIHTFTDAIFDAESFESHNHYIKEKLHSLTGVSSGCYLIEAEDRWNWRDAWGEAPGLQEQRFILGRIGRGRDSDGSGSIEIGSWIAFRFPKVVSERGFLLLKKADSIPGNMNISDLKMSVEHLIKPIAFSRQVFKQRMMKDNHALLPPSRDYADRILGQSQVIRRLKQKIRELADSPTTVHIVGETGTGKELIARAIHFCGQRRNRPFIAFNCSTSPETLVESELFGHCKGAFTGADRSRKGVFLAADRGTLFLDEVADLPLIVQAKLLRAIQERSIRPVGSDVDIPVDIRIISATHKDLRLEIEQNRFRQDLYYRLVVISLEAPALRDRLEDIGILAESFLNEFSKLIGRRNLSLSDRAIEWLRIRYWSGNVRELQNTMEIAVNYSEDGQVIDRDDLQVWIQSSSSSFNKTLAEVSAKVQVDYIRRVLHHCNANIMRSAEILGVSRQTLFQKMKSMGIMIPSGNEFLFDD
ncbi:sigma 54-interacting transcriptional regulator [bacterium]|nr:sigma 54-interacting transcriptional regulator [candidate division CSSED10-310 bacterium]